MVFDETQRLNRLYGLLREMEAAARPEVTVYDHAVPAMDATTRIVQVEEAELKRWQETKRLLDECLAVFRERP